MFQDKSGKTTMVISNKLLVGISLVGAAIFAGTNVLSLLVGVKDNSEADVVSSRSLRILKTDEDLNKIENQVENLANDNMEVRKGNKQLENQFEHLEKQLSNLATDSKEVKKELRELRDMLQKSFNATKAEDSSTLSLRSWVKDIANDSMEAKKELREIREMLQNSSTTSTVSSRTTTLRPVTTGKKEVLILRTEDASSVRKKEELLAKTRKSPYSIDILIVGSNNATKQVQTQRETWASHEAVRHFFLSTEDDDTNPMCNSDNHWSEDALNKYSRICKSKSFWQGTNAFNRLTNNFKTQFARVEWLKAKKNPQGWLCAQRRFATSFTSLVQIYVETQSLPDYFIIADDDTYVNIDHIVSQMIREPAELEAKGKAPIAFPSSETPVVTAGCRVRWPYHMVNFTIPFGGFGTFFSKGSLKGLIQPLYCNSTTVEFESTPCKKLLNKGGSGDALDTTIGEKKYFQPGDSLNQVLHKYSRETKHFCLHSDWFLAYIANFYNISQHTAAGGLGNWFDDQNTNVPENRLYSLKDSEMYYPNKPPQGQCKYNGEGGPDCNAESTVCHRVNIETLQKVYSGAVAIQQSAKPVVVASEA